VARLRRARGHLPWNGVDRWLKAARTIWLATVTPDGLPHVMPLWFWWDGKAIYFITSRPTQKARNLSREPRVVLHLGDGDEVLIVEGRAELVTDRAEQWRVDGSWRRKYVDPYSGARASIFENPEDDLYRVRPDRVMTWSYGTVGTRTDFVRL
jgi:PPOX class probable F420-dependent enzyme